MSFDREKDLNAAQYCSRHSRYVLNRAKKHELAEFTVRKKIIGFNNLTDGKAKAPRQSQKQYTQSKQGPI